MIKKLTFIMIMLVCILSSCRQEEIGLPNDETKKDKPSKAYMSFNLALAEDYSTRGDGDYDADWDPSEEKSPGGNSGGYNVGLAEERYIDHLDVFLFTYDNDLDDYTCVTKGSYTNITPEEGENSFSTKIVKLNNIELDLFDYNENTEYYALIVINANNLVLPELGDSYNTWATTPQENSMLFPKINYEEDEDGNTVEKICYYITMTNATGHINRNVETEEFNPQTLVKINNEFLTRNQLSDEELRELEKTSSRTTIYVQRNVAKVVLNTSSIQDEGFDAKKVVVGGFEVQMNVSNFNVDIANKKTYPVMRIEDKSKNLSLNWGREGNGKREFMHSGGYKTSGIEEFDRVFWGIDPNYSSKDLQHPDSEFTVLSNISGNAGSDWPQYCLENTFNYDCQLQGQTSRLVIKCRWAFHNYYTENSTVKRWGKIPRAFHEDTQNWNNEWIHTFEFNEVIDDQTVLHRVYYRIGQQQDILCRKCFEYKIKDVLKEDFTRLSFDWEYRTMGGFFALKDVLRVYKVDGNVETEITDEEYQAIATVLGLKDAINDPITVYEGNFNYYVVRIPHFDRTNDVPWDEANEVTRKADGTKIADYEEKHLGRYGVVRNVFYEVHVDAIHSLGYPCIPPITDDDTDDMPEEMNLAVTVKVLSWAKHDIKVSF